MRDCAFLRHKSAVIRRDDGHKASLGCDLHEPVMPLEDARLDGAGKAGVAKTDAFRAYAGFESAIGAAGDWAACIADRGNARHDLRRQHVDLAEEVRHE